MAVQLYVGHSGQRLVVDTSRITTLDALRAFTATHANILPNRQVLLTPKGKSVRPQHLLTENELFVFDSSLLSSSTADLSRNGGLAGIPAPLDTDDPPDTIANQTDLGSWQTLFRQRLSWASNQRERCASYSEVAQQAQQEQSVIQRGLSVALESLQLHIRGAEQKQVAAAAWADELLKEQERRLETWQNDSRLLESIPARVEFGRFIQHGVTGFQEGEGEATLQALMPAEQTEAAAKHAKATMTSLKKRLAGLKGALGEVNVQSEELLASAEGMQDTSSLEASMEPQKLMEEIDVLLKKITSDESHVNSLPRTAQSVSQASKMALLHTRNYLPNLQEFAVEMSDLARKAVQQRNHTAETCMQHMQTLSRIESLLSKIYTDVKMLNIPQEDQQAFTTLNIVSRLPYAYGSLLIEAVRRREWVEKMKKDSSTLAEEMATYQEEESRRRQRWLNGIDDVINPDLSKVKALGIEVNLQSDTENWPNISREEIEEYITTLKNLQYPEEVIQELLQAFRTLDQPTRKQVKHAKAFRLGSIHEAAFGTTSLALRGEDEYKVLRESHSKLEEELRGQKSRVRKLEDLLHRQTATSKVASGDVFVPGMEMSRPASPGLSIRRISEDQRVRSRRTSSNTADEGKRLARRIVMLEAEIQSLREGNLREVEEARGKVEEAESVKKDIMRNMEAQGREFSIERRGLEQELTGFKGRVEELEDELDRILGSRDQEHGRVDARARDLEGEIERVSGENHQLRQEVEGGDRRNRELERSLQDALDAQRQIQQRADDLEGQISAQREVESDAIAALSTAHTHLDPASETPEKFTTLVAVLEDLARRSAMHVKDLSDAVALARSENQTLIAQHATQTRVLKEANKKVDDVEDELARVKEASSSEVAKTKSLATQLDDEREQLKLLRDKFAEGETGADTLRQRVEESETQVGRLMEQLAEAKSSNNGLDVELTRTQSKLKTAQSASQDLSSRLQVVSVGAKEMSRRLYAQNARLRRLLETLGFAIYHKEGQMVIERASKVTGASTTLIEPSQILNRTVSLSSPAPHADRKLSDPIDADPSTLSFLNWPDSPTESAYHTLLSNLSLFNTDTFSDAISKRLRDFEYTARKFRLEARNANTKASKLGQEASSKLAVRDFKEGDLALFLPTKGKAVGAWAAFNINAPHHFLREREGMVLQRREWLVARITRVEERTVDLSRSMRSTKAENGDGNSISSLAGVDENPFELSDGLTWYLVHATEERGGAPTTPGLGKVTVQESVESARAEGRRKDVGEEEGKGVRDLKEKLGKSLESRRSSSTSVRRDGGSVKGVPISSRGAEDGKSQALVGMSRSPPPAGAGGSLLTAGFGMLKKQKERENGVDPGRDDGDNKSLSLPPVQIATSDLPVSFQSSPGCLIQTDPSALANAMADSMRLRTPSKSQKTQYHDLDVDGSNSQPRPGSTKPEPARRRAEKAYETPTKSTSTTKSSTAQKLTMRGRAENGDGSPVKRGRDLDRGDDYGEDKSTESGENDNQRNGPVNGARASSGGAGGWKSLWSVDYGIEH